MAHVEAGLANLFSTHATGETITVAVKLPKAVDEAPEQIYKEIINLRGLGQSVDGTVRMGIEPTTCSLSPSLPTASLSLAPFGSPLSALSALMTSGIYASHPSYHFQPSHAALR